jgi:glutathione S-transferase
MNGGMSAGVKIIRAMRSGIPEFEKYVFFRQEREAIRESLQWLEKDLANRTSYYPNRLTMLDITLMCYLEWALFRGMIPPVPQ